MTNCKQRVIFLLNLTYTMSFFIPARSFLSPSVYFIQKTISESRVIESFASSEMFRVRGCYLPFRVRSLTTKMNGAPQGQSALTFMENVGPVLEKLWHCKVGQEDWSPYSQEIVFQDPLQRTKGLAAYKSSLALLKNSSFFGSPRIQVQRKLVILIKLLTVPSQVHDTANVGIDRVRYRAVSSLQGNAAPNPRCLAALPTLGGRPPQGPLDAVV